MYVSVLLCHEVKATLTHFLPSLTWIFLHIFQVCFWSNMSYTELHTTTVCELITIWHFTVIVFPVDLMYTLVKILSVSSYVNRASPDETVSLFLELLN